jgi:hypothetical protein
MNRDPMDDLLQRAEWPAFPPEADARLRATLAAPPHQVLWPRRVAAIIALAIVSATVYHFTSRHQPIEPERAFLPTPAIAKPTKVESRPASPAELAFIMTAAPRHKAKTPDPKSAPHPETLADVLRSDPAKGVDRCLAMTAAGNNTEPVQALKQVRGPALDLLFTRLDDPRVDTRLTAARLLGKVDGPIVTERLAQMVAANRNRREALAALIQSDGPEARAVLTRASASPDLTAVIRSLESQVKGI